MEDDLYAEQGGQVDLPAGANFDKLFDFIDSNDDNKICKVELEKYVQLKGFNPTRDELQEFFNDNENDTTYTKEEFKVIVEQLENKLEEPEAALDAALDEIDTDGNGQFDKEELRQFLTTKGDSALGDEDLDNMFKDLGAEEETYISREALKNLLLAKVEFDE